MTRHFNDIPELPQWLADLAKPSKPKRVQNTLPIIPLDSEADITRATQWLQHEAAPSIEGQGGDENAYKVAARLKDFGVSESVALELMLDHWNERCAPPWDPEELERKVANAYEYGENPPGIASPAADFEPIDATIFGQAKPRERLYAIPFKDVEPDLQQIALIDDYLDRDGMSVVYGESNTGKSFLALDMAYHVAAGLPWFNKHVHKGFVAYVAAEGAGTMKKRIKALKLARKTTELPLVLVPCTVDLLRKNADTQPLIDLIAAEAGRFGEKSVLVVIDTLARALAGGNENSSEDMGALVMNLDRIRAASGAHVMVVHHSGKDQAKGARGHSSLRAATDTEIEIADRTARVTKQRDMEFSRPVGFTLEMVMIGKNRFGRDVTSCVVGLHDALAEQDFNADKLPKQAGDVFGALKTAIEKLGKQPEEADDARVFGRWVDVGVWRDFCRDILPRDKEAQRKAFKRAWDILVEQNLIEIYDKKAWVK